MKLDTLKKSWFSATLLSAVSLAWVILKLLNNLPNFIISAKRKMELSNQTCCFLAKFVFKLNPQIKIRPTDNWDILNDAQPFVMLINHTSQLDGFLFYARTPLKYAGKIRTLFKGELLEAPFLGDILRYGGHFPVHFMHSDVGKFSVDREKQAVVLEDIKEHLSNGGHLAFFPEGQINRDDPLKLQTFRQGLFKLLTEHVIKDEAPVSVAPSSEPYGIKNVNMYAFLHTGLEQSWHPKANLGGASSDVHCRIFPLLFSKESQAHEIQNTMQASLDSIHSSKRTKIRAHL